MNINSECKYYVDASRYNNRGMNLFNIQSPYLNARGALRLFRYWSHSKYASCEVIIHKLHTCKAAAMNNVAFIESRG